MFNNSHLNRLNVIAGTLVASMLVGSFAWAHCDQMDGPVVVDAISVTTPKQTYRMSANMMVVLDPGVPHAVLAHEPSELLLTVSLLPQNTNGYLRGHKTRNVFG